MSLVETELEIERKQMANAVYDLYENQGEGSNALDQCEADLERLASAYERTEEHPTVTRVSRSTPRAIEPSQLAKNRFIYQK